MRCRPAQRQSGRLGGVRLPIGRHVHGDNTDLHGVEKQRMRAEFAADYDVRMSRRIAYVCRVRLNVDEMPGNLPATCFADRTNDRVFRMLGPPAFNQAVVFVC